MSNQSSRKVRMGSSRRRLDRTSLLEHDVSAETQTDPSSMTVDTDSVNPNDSEHGNQLDFKVPISESLHETSEDLEYESGKCGSLLDPPTTFEIEAHANQSQSVSPKPSTPQKEDMVGNDRTENVDMSRSEMGMSPDESCQKTKQTMSKPGDDNMAPEVAQRSGDFSISSSPRPPLTDEPSNSPQQLSDSTIHKEQEREFRKEDSNDLSVSFSPGTTAESQEYLIQVNSDGTAVDGSGLDKDVKQTEVSFTQQQDGDSDKKSSRKKRRMGSSRRLGNQGEGGDQSGGIVESDFSADLNKTNESFETELKVEMKCDSESLEGGTSTDKADCLLLISPQSEIKETVSEDIIDGARKEIYTGGNINVSSDISLGDVDDRKEDESEEKGEIVEQMEVIQIPLSQTMAEKSNQEISEQMLRPYDEEELCRTAEPQGNDTRPPGAVFDLSEPEHDVEEKTCSQLCEPEGQANNNPWELIEDTAGEEGEGHPLNVGALQSEHSSASAQEENDPTFLTRSGNISFDDVTVDNSTKQPIAESIEPENNQIGSEKTVTLDSTIELKDRCNNDSNITTEVNPQSEDVEPTSSSVTLSDSHSVDDSPVESCLSTDMTEINPSATLPQVHSPGEDQINSVEIIPSSSSQLQDDSKQVGAQMSTGLFHSLGITEVGLNKSSLENENNPVEMPEVKNDFPQSSDGTAVDGSGLDKDVKQTEVSFTQQQDGDSDKKSSRKKRRMGSSRRLGNQGEGGDQSGGIVESDFSADLNKTNESFETELKVEMKCDSESLEGGTSTDKADCLLLISPQSEIKETVSEDIIDGARKEIYTGGNINVSSDISLGDVDDRKEDESEEKGEIVEKMEVIQIPLSQTMAEGSNQEISEQMLHPYDEEEPCRTAEPQGNDTRPPGVDFPMRVQNSLSKENTPHSLDINSSTLFAPVSDIRDNDDEMDTAGQHPTAHSSHLGQLSGQGNQGSLLRVKDDDKHILRRRKMGSSRWTKGSATGSHKGSKEAPTTEDQEREKDAVLSENISEVPQKQIRKENEGAAEKVATNEEEPKQTAGETHRSTTEENTREKQQVDSEVSEDKKIFTMKVNNDEETEQNGERSSEAGVKPVNTALSALPIALHVEGRRRKLGSQRKSRGQHYHDYPPKSPDHGARTFGDHPQPAEPLRQVVKRGISLYVYAYCTLSIVYYTT